MSCHDHPALHTLWSQGQTRAVVERADYPTFRVGQVLIGRQFQASLDLGSLQDLLVFATHDIRESCQIGEDGSRAILPIQAQHGTLFGVIVRLEICSNGRHCSTQFCPVFAIARISKSADPLMRMSLQYCGARSHDFSTFAPGVARGADGAQATLGRGSIWRLWQGSLAGGLTCAINVEDNPPTSLSVP